MSDIQDLMTMEEVGEYLKVSERTAYSYTHWKVNPLPVVHLSDRTKRVRGADLTAWLAKVAWEGKHE